MMRLRALILCCFAVVGMVLLTGCKSEAAKAQALLSQGQYQQVIDKYPGTQFARRAEAKIAEQLLDERKYDEIVEKYPQTPAAYLARQSGAQTLYDEGKYEELLRLYPHSSVSEQAKEVLADSLHQAGNFDALIDRFPESAPAKRVKEDRSKDAYADVLKKSGKDLEDALNAFIREYRGTELYKEAVTKLREVRSKNRKR